MYLPWNFEVNTTEEDEGHSHTSSNREQRGRTPKRRAQHDSRSPASGQPVWIRNMCHKRQTYAFPGPHPSPARYPTWEPCFPAVLRLRPLAFLEGNLRPKNDPEILSKLLFSGKRPGPYSDEVALSLRTTQVLCLSSSLCISMNWTFPVTLFKLQLSHFSSF